MFDLSYTILIFRNAKKLSMKPILQLYGTALGQGSLDWKVPVGLNYIYMYTYGIKITIKLNVYILLVQVYFIFKSLLRFI